MKRLSVTLNEEYIFENYKLTNYSVNQPTAPKLRSSIIDWLFVINRTLSDTPYTFFHAMKIFDSFSHYLPLNQTKMTFSYMLQFVISFLKNSTKL